MGGGGEALLCVERSGVGEVGGVVFHCLGFWLVRGVLVGFSNGI